MSPAARQRFWQLTRRLTLGLLGCWLAVTLLLPWFARDLQGWRGFGFPAGYWLAAQGALLAYLLIIVIYVVVMDRLEGRYLAGDEGQPTGAADNAGAGPT